MKNDDLILYSGSTFRNHFNANLQSDGSLSVSDKKDLFSEIKLSSVDDPNYKKELTSTIDNLGNTVLLNHEVEFLDEIYDLYFLELIKLKRTTNTTDHFLEVTTCDMREHTIFQKQLVQGEVCMIFQNGDDNCNMWFGKPSRLTYLHIDQNKEYGLTSEATNYITIACSGTLLVFIKLRKKDEREYGLRVDPCTRRE